jgi:hypothetical protein
MINGPMAEAQKGFAVIDDIDEGTFVRFIEWAYNGYYDAAKYELDLEPPKSHASKKNKINGVAEKPAKDLLGLPSDDDAMPVAEEPEEAELATSPVWDLEQPPASEPPAERTPAEPDKLGWAGFGSARKSPKKSKKDSYSVSFSYAQTSTMRSSGQDLKESFIKRRETVRKHSISLPQPRRNQGSNENYTKVFLSHAHLYVFADKYDIQALKTLALEELQAMLKIFDLYLERTGDIIALLRYVYANTGEPDVGVEKMRALLTHYVGCEMDTLMKDDDFRDLMIEDGGALLGDFMTMVGKRIC